ncbi:MAG: hypothetical protein K0U74_09725 [Alphaproteobacteria bacterium]|nr:hypothetical protein [Alphaproteobacteria bacterium]
MSRRNDKKTSALQLLRGVMLALALTLPLLSLSAFGIWWLWQSGWLLIWSASATLVAICIFGLQALVVWRSDRHLKDASTKSPDVEAQGPHPDEPRGLTPREQAAWDAIETIARDIDPAKLTDRDAILQAGIDTIKAVATEMHPDEKEPLWKFTVPEALAVTQQVSTQLRGFVTESIPLGDRLTIGQLLTLYRWRSLITASERAYVLWRILRFANPAAAIAGELREKISGKLIDGLRTELTRRLARAYIREVGQAAVDLYSGRLRLETTAAESLSQTQSQDASERPVSVLLIGQKEAGKTSLAVALSEQLEATVETMTDAHGDHISVLKGGNDEFSAILIETPSLDDEPATLKRLVDQATDCDVILSVVSATRPDRALDQTALDQIRDAYSQMPTRRQPPICAVLTGIDKVRPFREWQPPYDLNEPTTQKANSIRQATEAVSDDLDIETHDIVPVMTQLNSDSYNIDVLWSKLLEQAPQARKAQIARQLNSTSNAPIKWSELWSQSLNAGRVLGRTIAKGTFRKKS